MKVTLPENISEITLGQFQKLVALALREDLPEMELNKRKIEIFTKIPRRDIKNIAQSDYESILKQIDTAMSTDVEFTNKFTMDGVEYGFIPNLDDITTAEYVDMAKFREEPDTLHNLMSILFRPIVDKDVLGNYIIETYDGSNDVSEKMRGMPLHVVNGALGFFYHLANELQIHIQKSTRAAILKASAQRTTLKSGDGTQLS